MLEPIKPEEVAKIVESQIRPSLKTPGEPADITIKSSGDSPCAGNCGKVLPRRKLYTSYVPDTCPECDVAAEAKHLAEQKAIAVERRRQFAIQCRIQSGITERELVKTFASFKVADDNAKARTLAIDTLNRGNLLILGQPGVGKTHLALAMVNAWVEQARPVKFFPVGRLLAEARGCFDVDMTEVDFVEKLMKHPLVIDDFGTAKLTEWSLSFMDLLIDEWYRHGKEGLVITSNFYPDQIVQKISARIGSRLNEMCRMTELKGHDRRI